MIRNRQMMGGNGAAYREALETVTASIDRSQAVVKKATDAVQKASAALARDASEREVVKRLYAAKAAEDQRLVAKKAADERTEKKAAASEMDAYLAGK